MAKIEIDILESALDDSGDGEPEMELGMGEENSFGNDGEEKSLPSQVFLDSGEDDVSYNFRDPSTNAVTYRLLSVNDDLESDMTSIGPGEVYPGGATIEKAPPIPMQTLLTNPINGQVFVIGSSGELYTTPGTKTIAPRDSNTRVTNIVKKRDDRRRATHNEVERRRRDKINNWILRLSKIIPSSPDSSDKIGLEGQSKGGILAKACEYIVELKNSQQRLNETVKDNEIMASEIIKLNQQITLLKKENTSLRYQLSNGVLPQNEPPEVS